MRPLVPSTAAAALLLTALAAPPAARASVPPAKTPVAEGYGGAVATVDADATAAGLSALRAGGNAVDAAVAAAAALGVTEPYSAGVGGGGYLLYYEPRTHRVLTLDGRETAPRAMGPTAFTEDGKPLAFADAVTSGLSVGVPGTPATWDTALRLWGRRSLGQALAPATAIARQGFVVDQTFATQTASNAARFAEFPSTSALYLPGGQPPVVGSLQRNPDLAATYDLLARKGISAFYTGALAHDVATTAQHPPVAAGVTGVRPGLMTTADLAAYAVRRQAPTLVRYEGLDVYGIAPSSSGGTTVGEALNILERQGVKDLAPTQQLHRYLDASALAFADRNRLVGDPAYVRVPERRLLSQAWADKRSCLISPDRALVTPVTSGIAPGGTCGSPVGVASPTGYEGTSTTHLVTSDRWGGVVSYTLTIEQTGGSGIVVPHRGFLLNNELTDFSFTDTQGGHDPNLPAPGKRPRSSISPTIVLRHHRPFLAVGSPGGATIITTVLQVLLGRLDQGLTLPQAIAAPRASQRNTAAADAEAGFDTAALEALGHRFAPSPEIGAAVGLELEPGGRVLAAAEPVRRGGGAAGVVSTTR
ncbi:gamma-glutamyltranspeptidase/glutathione hydrolase [Motilibacter rhizosphaerae]|uniref:Gamma-glutamyltranspeptidase/glutathione hydrolase n=1 Tax=Motilibacter rhizosphaerae TaxID=598652 RepID=A0A4V2F518_9ACTN|nr:gamma-glutamyltransferase [Motilibacter rhizosphaerae]RZS91269.1 gamma-glutamyltranspeptidase/glutathione hydrolase [Motilibacter rhizosphaerae]